MVEDEVVQSLDVNGFIRNDIGCDELAATFFVEGLHGGILDARELKDDAFNFLKLDAEATNLDLAVFTSHKLDIAIGEITDDVTGTVNVGVFLIGFEGVGDIDLCGFLRTVEVATAHLWSGNP